MSVEASGDKGREPNQRTEMLAGVYSWGHTKPKVLPQGEGTSQSHDFGQGRVGGPTLSRKAARGAKYGPYRKPTQVGGERIPRRLREPSLRNSAN